MTDERLEKARAIINEVDADMARLFEKRMEAAALVAAYKQDHHLPILDAKREEENIARNSALIADETLRPYYEHFLRDVMKVSRMYQQRLMEEKE
ncbi:MAG: chorismate mutase [Clostridia bacterium]|nr:chorismate mutase [Clostridia bacterium]